MTAPEVQCFHVATVVRDLDAAVAAYTSLLDAQTWRIREMSADFRIAYGSGSGQTWELIEVRGEGTSQFHQFRDRYGEGVQHVGFWTPDIRALVEQALAQGGELVSATQDASGVTSVQLVPQAAVTPDLLDAGIGIGAFIEGGLGAWRIELIGNDGDEFLRDWLQEDYDEILVTPRPGWSGFGKPARHLVPTELPSAGERPALSS
ncbi:MAG TPA: VOC family protein [Dehalococcoidia bacterium]|nr:VOC family protein [Dehalococcoidia bacterium]